MDVGNGPLFDISAIKEILPHRDPFLFVDRVTELEVEKRIVTEKSLSPEDHCFAGHFPGNPVMPGVLVSEALAQTSGLLIGLTWKAQGRPLPRSNSGMLLLANANVKFSSPVKPGDTLRLEAHLKKQYGKLFYFEVKAFVKDNVVAKGTLALAEEG